jgi:hypothetical protein
VCLGPPPYIFHDWTSPFVNVVTKGAVASIAVKAILANRFFIAMTTY